MGRTPSQPKQLLTEKELAQQTGFTTRTLYEKRINGELPFIRLGRSIRYDQADVENFIERYRVGAPTTGTNATTHLCRS